jgi:hypothetical protein
MTFAVCGRGVAVEVTSCSPSSDPFWGLTPATVLAPASKLRAPPARSNRARCIMRGASTVAPLPAHTHTQEGLWGLHFLKLLGGINSNARFQKVVLVGAHPQGAVFPSCGPPGAVARAAMANKLTTENRSVRILPKRRRVTRCARGGVHPHVCACEGHGNTIEDTVRDSLTTMPKCNSLLTSLTSSSSRPLPRLCPVIHVRRKRN